MGRMITGYYILVEKDVQVSIIRRVTIEMTDHEPFTTLIRAGQEDPRYLKLSHPEVTPVIDDPGQTTCLVKSPAMMSTNLHTQTKGHLSVQLAECEGCKAPLLPYAVLVATRRTHCPWCNKIFTHVATHPQDIIALQLAVTGINDPQALFMENFRFPYGFPIPKLLDGTNVKKADPSLHDEARVGELLPWYLEIFN